MMAMETATEMKVDELEQSIEEIHKELKYSAMVVNYWSRRETKWRRRLMNRFNDCMHGNDDST